MGETMIVVDVDKVRRHSTSVALGAGRDPDGRRIVFAGDSRLLGEIAQALDDGEPCVPATVPEWAIVAWGEIE